MDQLHYEKIAKELNITAQQVSDTAAMIAEGATVPFIARYRKEVTGSLDEVAITAIRDRLQQLEELDDRREAILKSLTERNLLTDELARKDCRGGNHVRSGRYLSAVSAQTPDAGDHCPGKGAGAAG